MNKLLTRYKVIYFFCLIFFLSITGCDFNIKQFDNNVTIEKRELTQFDSIVWEGIGDLKIENSSDHTITIASHKDYIDKIKTEVRDKTLYISEDSGWLDFSTYGEREYLISAESIKKIQLNGVGNIEIYGSKTKQLDLILNGKGKIFAKNLKNDDLNIKINGFGDIEAHGDVERQKIQISGSGSYIARKLKSDNTEITISGIGLSELNVKENLKVNISGKGNVIYTGDAVLSQKVTGMGEINKRD